ncbi:MAG TPA: uroporphyrinogen decarboxylase [Sphingobacteriaceae bacterium]|nr:uroporphyrinogen decarboxylase [Sphingobacteriaceae bacterium]
MSRDRFLKACRREPVDKTPVWFMRQAGRIFPQYRALREKYDFLTMCRTPELAAQVTLLPIEHLEVDAAIIFADIMLPLEGLGVDFNIEPTVGPVMAQPIRDEEAVARLRQYDPREVHDYLMQAIALVKKELAGLPLIGFAGAPFTLACYMIEGRPSREFTRARQLMFARPDLWHRLMSTLSDNIAEYMAAQAEAGAQALQLFDSWVGVLSPWDYEQFVLPYSRRIFRHLRETHPEVPLIHFGTGTATLLPLMAAAGPDVVGVDWRIGLDKAWDLVGPQVGVQGNLDPAVLLGSEAAVDQAVQRVLAAAAGRPGHIFNLGHGVLPDTPVEVLQRVIHQVHMHPLDKPT